MEKKIPRIPTRVVEATCKELYNYGFLTSYPWNKDVIRPKDEPYEGGVREIWCNGYYEAFATMGMEEAWRDYQEKGAEELPRLLQSKEPSRGHLVVGYKACIAALLKTEV